MLMIPRRRLGRGTAVLGPETACRKGIEYPSTRSMAFLTQLISMSRSIGNRRQMLKLSQSAQDAAEYVLRNYTKAASHLEEHVTSRMAGVMLSPSEGWSFVDVADPANDYCHA
jgi:hypothetical protein